MAIRNGSLLASPLRIIGTETSVSDSMSKIVSAEYDEKGRALRLTQPLEGVRDGERVEVTIVAHSVGAPPWARLRGILSGEAGEDLARVVEEMFPTEK
jgi:hypothetical protein